MSTLLLAWLGCLGFAALLWFWSVIRWDASVVDIWWGLGFVGVTWWYRSQGPQPEMWHWVHLAMVTLWGVRLGAHIAWRSRGHGEDHRYTAMRESHGNRFWWVSFFTVFSLQATLVVLISTPLLATQSESVLISPALFWIGTALWLVGFAFEAIGDWQLLRFKRDPQNRGQVLDRGLWRYSRHPNYFGETVLWWGFGLTAVAVGGAWTLYAPVVMTFLLLKVSGVVLLEKTIGHRRPDYARYVRETSAFFPRPPRRKMEEALR